MNTSTGQCRHCLGYLHPARQAWPSWSAISQCPKAPMSTCPRCKGEGDRRCESCEGLGETRGLHDVRRR